MADGVDRDIDAPLVGQRTSDVTRALLVQMDRDRPEAAGDLEARGHRVDREHRAGAGGERDLDRAQPTGPSPSTATLSPACTPLSVTA